jgi:hypothetical protein
VAVADESRLHENLLFCDYSVAVLVAVADEALFHEKHGCQNYETKVKACCVCTLCHAIQIRKESALSWLLSS